MFEFELSKPVNGVSTLNIDVDELSMADYRSALVVRDLIKVPTKETLVNDTFTPRADSELRIALAWISAIKNNNKLSINDILSLSAKDGLMLSEAVLLSFLV